MSGEPHQADAWLDVHALARLADISRVKASAAVARCRAGGAWRGCRLEIREEHGRGGRSGARYLVAEHSLPLDWRYELRRSRGYDPRTAARRLVVDELERLAAEHGRRRAIAMVLERANGGDLLPALEWAAGFTAGARELTRAALTRWQRQFAKLAKDLEDEPLAVLAREHREWQLRQRMPERKPAAPSIHHGKITRDDLREAARVARAALPAPAPMPRRARRVA
jgi:hypothetical protein